MSASNFEQALHIADASRRQMLRDFAGLFFTLTSLGFFLLAIFAPDSLQRAILQRPEALLNLAGLNMVAAYCFWISRHAKNSSSVRLASRVFVGACFLAGLSGSLLAGFGIRAFALHCLLLVLVFVTFQEGSRFANRFLAALITLVLCTGIGELSGRVRGVTEATQPQSLIVAGVLTLMLIMLVLLFRRFEQRYDALRGLLIAQREQLEQGLSQLKRALQRRAAFSRLLSHSTRTPLAGIQFVTELLQRPNASAAVLQRTLASLQRQTYRLRMMTTHLDLARRIRDPDPVHALHPVDLHAVWSQCLLNASTEASHRNIALELDTSASPIQLELPLEQRLVSELVQILMDNAIKAQTGGFIRVVFVHTDTHCRTEVHDQGPGLPPGEVSRLLKPLGEAISDGGAAGAEGLGLGLPIVRSLCDQAGGTCGWHASTTGGSVLWVELPVVMFNAASDNTATDTASRRAPSVTQPAYSVAVGASDAVPGNAENSPTGALNDRTSNHRLHVPAQPAAATVSIPERVRGFTRRLITVYLFVLGTLVLMSLLNNIAQYLQGGQLLTHAVVNLGLMGSLLITAAWVLHKDRIASSVALIMAALFVAIAHVMLFVGAGVRVPIVMLLTATVALAHFQFGFRLSVVTAVISGALIVTGFALETVGLIPGTRGIFFVPASNFMIIWLAVYGLNYLTIHDMQRRAEFALTLLETENRSLADALNAAQSADRGQDHFLDAVSPRLLSDCRELAALSSELGGSPAGSRQQNALLQAITRLNTRVIAGFDAAVAALENAQNTPPAGLQLEPDPTSNGDDRPSNAWGTSAGDVRELAAWRRR